MCGHLGFALNRPHPGVVPMMATMSIFMDKRGGHSWGYWADNLPIKKGMGLMSKELDCHEFKNSKQVIAHCRWATHGAKEVHNSHPFVQGNVIGAHNGVIMNHEELNKEFGREFEVDSQHIFQHISDGLDLADLSGYGAIVWTTVNEPHCINFCKFNGGSLEIAELFEGEEFLGTVWASTQEALEIGVRQSGLSWKFLTTVNQTEYVINEESRAFSIEGSKMAIEPSSKWSRGGGTSSKGTDFQEAWEAQGWERLPSGVYRRKQDTGITVATVTEEHEEASGDVGEDTFIQALFNQQEAEAEREAAARTADARLRTGDHRGEDLDRLIRDLWRSSGTFYHRGKCFACGGEHDEVVKHSLLKVRLCYDCCYEWEDAKSDVSAPAGVLVDDFIASVAVKRGVNVQQIRAALHMQAGPLPDNEVPF